MKLYEWHFCLYPKIRPRKITTCILAYKQEIKQICCIIVLIIVGNIDSVDGIFRKTTWIVTDWKGLSYKYNVVTVYLWNLVSCLDSDAYLLLTEFEVHTGSYGPSFSPLIYGPSAKRAGHKLKGRKRGSVTYGTDRENEVSKIFMISLLCVWRAQEPFLFKLNVIKILKHLESKTSQFEIV